MVFHSPRLRGHLHTTETQASLQQNVQQVIKARHRRLTEMPSSVGGIVELTLANILCMKLTKEKHVVEDFHVHSCRDNTGGASSCLGGMVFGVAHFTNLSSHHDQ